MATPQVYELNLRDYWNIFLKRKWIMLLSFFAVVISTIIHTSMQPIRYRTSTIIKIEPILGLSKMFAPKEFWMPPSEELSDYTKQVTSLPIIKKALRALALEAGEVPSEQELNSVIHGVARRIRAYKIEKTSMIEIEMTSEDREEIVRVLNKMVEVFKLENITHKNRQASNVKQFIEQQLEKIETTLKASEDKVRMLTLKGVGGLVASLKEKIAKLEAERLDLLSKFTEIHPAVLKLEDQIVALKERLKTLPREEFEFSNLKAEYDFNKELYNFLRRELQEAKIRESEKIDNVILISPAIMPNRPYSPNRPLNYMVGAFLGLIFGVFIGLIFEHLDTSIGRIEDLESATKTAVIGVIPYFTEKGKGKATDVKEILKKRKNIFSFAKQLQKEDRLEKLRSQLITAHKESSIFLEAFRILSTNIQVIFGEGGKIKEKCILVTSSNPQEGKSIIAANLSIIMAQMGYSTVIVDTDLRRSSIHKIFGLKKKDNGVTDILTGEASLESALKSATDLLLGDMDTRDILKNPWIDNFHLITAGKTFPNSPYLLNTEKMAKLLKDLRARYDITIMDSSPILAVSDTSIIVPKVDGVILVYKAGVTSRIALRRAKLQIETAKATGSLKGIVLNNVTPETSADTYYYYYRGKYYNYEGDSEKEEDSKTTA